MSELAADLVRREVAVIATPGTPPASVLVVMARTTTIPIVFAIGDDPVKWGIVANLAHPNSNATGVNFFTSEVLTKRLELLHDLLPGAVRIAVLLNSADAKRAEEMLSELRTRRPQSRGCRFKSSTRAPKARSMPPSRRWRASVLTRFLSAPSLSSTTAGSSS